MNPDEPEKPQDEPNNQPSNEPENEPQAEAAAEPPQAEANEPPPYLRNAQGVSPSEPEAPPVVEAAPEPPPPPPIAPPIVRRAEPPPPPPPELVHEPEPEPEPVTAYEPEPEPAPPPRTEPPRRRDVFESPPREPEIPMPDQRRGGDKRRARDARKNLDLDLGRIKRQKRYGFFMTLVSVVFIAFVLAPVAWVAAYGFVNAPSTILMMQRAAEGETIRHYPVPINRISPHVIRAVIAAEDARFCTHDGFDVEAIQDAMRSNARGRGPTRGASTVSQQVAKNLFLWPERSWVRKGFETYFTALIEFMWPKRRIMEHYLNVAEWGDGNFGIEAAARARFGVSAADLTPLQAARLAAVLPNPNEWRADRPGPYVRSRSATLVSRARVVRNERTASCVLIMDRPN